MKYLETIDLISSSGQFPGPKAGALDGADIGLFAIAGETTKPPSPAIMDASTTRSFADEEKPAEALKQKNGGGKTANGDDFSYGENGIEEEELIQPQIRSDFRESTYWNAHITTNKQGKATIEVEYPEQLTTWETVVRAITKDTKVGSVTHQTITTKNLLVRLITPRFFQERDEVIISGIVHNYLAKDKTAHIKLEVEGLTLLDEAEQKVIVPHNGEYHIEWRVKSESLPETGLAKITLSALTNEESDAMQKEFPIFPYGVEMFKAFAGEVKDEIEIKFDLPKERNIETTQLMINLTPSIASAIIEPLPYLAGYPYGCVEQTMSRFLPDVIVAQTMQELGLWNKDTFQTTNYVKLPAEFQKLQEELPLMVEDCLKRLTNFQHNDGGWGWWQNDNSRIDMSAYVVYGLVEAQRADFKVSQDMIDRGVDYLRNNAKTLTGDLNELLYVLYVLSYTDSERPSKEILTHLFDRRADLTDYSRALLLMCLKNANLDDKVEILLRNLEDKVIEKEKTAHWGKPNSWWWYDNTIESTSYILRAIMQVNPEHHLIPKIVRWLLDNRRGTHWQSTKDTAIAIYALSDYLHISNELEPDYNAIVYLNGEKIKSYKITKANILGVEPLTIPNEQLAEGENTIKIVKKGKGSLNYSAYLGYYSTEEDIKSQASEGLQIERTYYRITHKKNTQGNLEEVREPMKEVFYVGDEIEVEIKITADNDFQYIMVEDPKPAGCEAAEVKSGYDWSNWDWAEIEYRDEKVCTFYSWLRRGEHTLTYRLRAEVQGDFWVMPTRIEPMYAPEKRALSDNAYMPIVNRKRE